ncbi:MAG: hypothetical protein CMP10_18650 [Zetaproteobacteria bacterium]|mgnify:CR=1 FL=1|nr:hypothetical protein [Pseudobdellovibrionaceae bacterium]
MKIISQGRYQPIKSITSLLPGPLVTLALLLITTLPLELRANESTCPNSPLSPGKHDGSTIYDGRERSYNLVVPSAKKSPLPLVINMHGYTSSADDLESISGMSSLANAEGFVVAYPNSDLQSWNGGDCCGEAAAEGTDDIGYLKILVRHIKERVCIDSNRIYLAGYSNGGFMAYRAACQAPGFFAAVGSVAGVLGIEKRECQPTIATPMIHIHGTWDRVVRWDGGASSAGVFKPVEDGFNHLLTVNQCRPESEPYYERGNTMCLAYPGCGGIAEKKQVLCTVYRGLHCWPGSLGCNASINASAALWDFFKNYELD